MSDDPNESEGKSNEQVLGDVNCAAERAGKAVSASAMMLAFPVSLWFDSVVTSPLEIARGKQPSFSTTRSTMKTLQGLWADAIGEESD